MALDPGGMMMKLSPTAPIDLGDWSGTEREKLRIMREQMEATRKQRADQLEMQKLAENGRMARERMMGEREQAAAEAQAQAKHLEAQQKAQGEFLKLNGEGDIEGARAMVPLMDSLGIDVELQGEDPSGLPRYRVDLNPKATAAAASQKQGSAAAAGDEMGAAGIGYDTANDTGTLDEPQGISNTADAFGAAQQASKFSEQTGQPYRQPDSPDFTGGVPRNVIDTGAIQQATLARLNPALGALQSAYPEPYRESAGQTAKAVSGMGLPGGKALEVFDKLRGGPDSLIRAQIDAEAQAGQNAEKRAQPTAVEAQRLVDMGMKQAKSSATEIGVKTALEATKAAKTIESVLTDNDPTNDKMIGSLMSSMMAEKGPKTEGDIKRALGMDSMATIDQVMAYIDNKLVGGLSHQQKNAILGVVKNSQDIDRKKIHGFLRSIDDEVNSEGMNEHVGRGWRRYRDTVIPKDIRDEYEASKGETKGQGSTPQGDGAEGTITGEVTIPDSARIAKVHNNPGNLMFNGQEGAEKGEPKEGGGNWAKFASPEAGLQALRAQIEKDSDMTIRSFISKYAPPTDGNDTEKYIKDATKELRAQDGDKVGEVDSYDLLRFISRKESGTELPGQYSKPAPENQDLPPIKTEADKQAAELLTRIRARSM